MWISFLGSAPRLAISGHNTQILSGHSVDTRLDLWTDSLIFPLIARITPAMDPAEEEQDEGQLMVINTLVHNNYKLPIKIKHTGNFMLLLYS